MENVVTTDGEKGSSRLVDSEASSQSKPEHVTPRPVDTDPLQPSRPEVPPRISSPKEATAAGGPGSEYWLP